MVEISTIRNRQGLSLSYVLNNGMTGAPVIVLVHGFAGSKDENGLFKDAESYFSHHGFNTFRFDFSGCGGSSGDFIDATLRSHVDDLRTVLDHISKSHQGRPIVVLGFSLGATVALLLNDPRVVAYALWSPALSPAKDMYPRYATANIRTAIASQGFYPKAGLRLGAQMLADLSRCSLERLAPSLESPVLLVHGTGDSRISWKTTTRFKNLFRSAETTIINGADHSFKQKRQHRDVVLKQTAAWLKQIPAISKCFGVGIR